MRVGINPDSSVQINGDGGFDFSGRDNLAELVKVIGGIPLAEVMLVRERSSARALRGMLVDPYDLVSDVREETLKCISDIAGELVRLHEAYSINKRRKILPLIMVEEIVSNIVSGAFNEAGAAFSWLLAIGSGVAVDLASQKTQNKALEIKKVRLRNQLQTAYSFARVVPTHLSSGEQ